MTAMGGGGQKGAVILKNFKNKGNSLGMTNLTMYKQERGILFRFLRFDQFGTLYSCVIYRITKKRGKCLKS
jgi:hypothetical protein